MTKRSINSLNRKHMQKHVFSKFPYQLMHSCGKPAFYINKKVEDGDIINPKDVIFPDGTMPKDGTGAFCGSCKQQMYHSDFDIKNIRSIQ